MHVERFDVFENEEEISEMITKLQRKGLENMVCPDEFWSPKNYKIAIKSTHKTNKRVLSSL